METYAKTIATNDKVEMVHLSADRNAKAATTWAAKEKFPWPTVLPEKVKATGLEKYAAGYVPDYILVDKEGKELARKSGAVFAKLKELTE
ncbi:TlpA family protein disulfide reductase [Sulfuriroseicoccus oceanibius]|uniref:Thioredoxin-like fold domain-containing protein n=1 Tax=Sulfuriroseicoccus oceanibius TaxID=2707525 RepID=A0A6B3L898_9BACT|nr:hypothetical protein [Sulfuriroseicoccus oceanibius]QQL44933.1 hypothetical protein G3M56_013865 [Sulfuriroseicoccus oceanibius]